MARIAVVGPGAIGGAMAAWLDKTGRHQVILCARHPFTELRVTSGDQTFVSNLHVLTSPADAFPVDWVLIATKAYDVAGAAAWLKRLAENGAPVAILQNGVEHRERFSAYVTADKILPVMVDCPAERSAPGQINIRGAARMAVQDEALGRAFAELFAETPVSVETVSDFRSAIWQKLCLNSAGALSALLLKPAGVMRDERLGDVARGLVRECIAVGRAEGAVLDDSLVESVLQSYRNAPPDSVNSLHADRAAGRPMEVDARNGVIVRLGRKHHIATPFNETVVALLNAIA